MVPWKGNGLPRVFSKCVESMRAKSIIYYGYFLGWKYIFHVHQTVNREVVQIYFRQFKGISSNVQFKVPAHLHFGD